MIPKTVLSPDNKPTRKLKTYNFMIFIILLVYCLVEMSTSYVFSSFNVIFIRHVPADLFAEEGLRQRLDNIPGIFYFLPLSFLIISKSFSFLATVARPNIARTVNTIKRGELR